jgi:histidinol phosphatase-like enzyme
LKKENAEIDGLYFCPHSPEDNCDCRKPETGLIKRAMAEHKLDLKDAVVIGDKLSDVELGKKLRAKTVLVLTGYGKKEAEKAKVSQLLPDFIANDLLDAVSWLKKTSLKESD